MGGAAALLLASAALAAEPTTFLRHFRIGMSAREAAAALPGCVSEPMEALPVGCDKATGRCPRGTHLRCPLGAEGSEKAPVAPALELWAEGGPRGLLLATMEWKGPPAEVFAKLEGVAGKLARKHGKWREAGSLAYTETGEKGRYYRWELSDLNILAEARRPESSPSAAARGRAVFVRRDLDVPGWAAPLAVPEAPPAPPPAAPAP